MKASELEKLPIPFQQHATALEQRVMADIVRRIQINQEITSTADWQAQRLYQMGMSKKDIKKIIADSLKMDKTEVEKLFHDALYEEYIRNEAIYKKGGAEWIPYEKNEELQALVKAVSQQTADTFKNMSGSLGFAIKSGGKVVYTPLLDYYQGTLDAAVMDIASGAFDYNTVLRRTVNQMTTSGLRWIDYDSGHHNRVDVAARRAVLTGVNQVQAKINEQVARDLKTDYFEVTWHGGARPEHQVWQGRVFNHKQLVSVCKLGDVTGLCGANCYHSYNAFIPGVSVRTYTDAQLDQMNAAENVPKSYNGREYTTYEALQRQRELETIMRKQRQDISLLKRGGAAESDLLAAKSRYRVTMGKYADFSAKMGLPQQKDRINMDGLGRLASGKGRAIVKPQKGGIIKNSNSSNWNGLNYTQSYTKKSAVERLKKEYGIKFSDSRKYPMDDGLLADCVGWLDSFSKEYSGFKSKNPVKIPVIACKAPSAMQNSVGYYKYYSGIPRAVELALNGMYHSDGAAFQAYADSCVRSKWYPANATTHKTFVHEYGHYVSHSMSCISGKADWQKSFIQDCIKEYNSQYGSSLKGCVDCADLVSRYGASSDGELFAEAFAEYFGGKNPREFARIFGNKLDAVLKGVK